MANRPTGLYIPIRRCSLLHGSASTTPSCTHLIQELTRGLHHGWLSIVQVKYLHPYSVSITRWYCLTVSSVSLLVWHNPPLSSSLGTSHKDLNIILLMNEHFLYLTLAFPDFIHPMEQKIYKCFKSYQDLLQKQNAVTDNNRDLYSYHNITESSTQFPWIPSSKRFLVKLDCTGS